MGASGTLVGEIGRPDTGFGRPDSGFGRPESGLREGILEAEYWILNTEAEGHKEPAPRAFSQRLAQNL